MPDSNYITTELSPDAAILTVTLDRADNERNQINTGMVEALQEILVEHQARPGIRGLIIASAREKVFSTGADIEGELGQLSAVEAARFSRIGSEVFGILTQLPCPTLAAVSGFALGGGLELALCCDFRLAAANARLGLPEINLGVIPGWGGTQRLQRLIGRSRAMRMILTGDPVNAATALEFGLIDEIAESYADLLPRAQRFLGKFAGKSRQALAVAKQAIYQGGDTELSQGLALESELFGRAWSTEHRREGIQAYLEKRRPKWPE